MLWLISVQFSKVFSEFYELAFDMFNESLGKLNESLQKLTIGFKKAR